MPITIVTPQTGDPFGPGFTLEWSTDRIGPEPPGSFWSITLWAPPLEFIVALKEVPWTSAVNSTVLVRQSVGPVEMTLVKSDWLDGAAARLRVQLASPTPALVEEESVDVVLDRQTGQAQELAEWIRGQLGAQPVGLTTAQGEQLQRVEAGMAVGLGVLPVDLVGGLADALINGPGLSVGSFSAAYSLTGDGEMPDIATTFRTRLGIYFVATTIPAGLGHRHGQSEEYPARLVQWRTVHSVAGIELVTEVADFVTHGEIWRWREAKPLRIEYSVLPGVTLSARWHWWP